ncbi:Oligopeptide transport ATP-binding protein OppD [Minicystis rosea]|nr:Oligopeptide transport ATP-binding protein OppD [Minicystis rosea]
MSGDPLLSIRDLSVSFVTDGGLLRAVDHVSFDVPRGRTVALVGESGCGKSVTAHSIMRLLPSPPARTDGGEILLEGRDLLKLDERSMRAVRGARIGMIFQEPMTSLNPVYTIGFQIAEAIRLHRDVSRSEARRLSIEGLARVGFPEPARRVDNYPHELSGGMRQRVLIAIALACSPALLVADEPTTALDATVQAQILALLAQLREEAGMSLLLIAHDLALVGEVADDIVVLYAGVVVERGPARAVLSNPAHPYTRALLRSLPPRAHRARGERGRKLPTIEGSLPDLRSPPPGCRFQDRCPDVTERCRVEPPALVPAGNGATARCFLVEPRNGELA